MVDYSDPKVQEKLKQIANEFESTCSLPELIYKIVFVEKITPDTIRNQMIYDEFIKYIRLNRYGRNYIYTKLAEKHGLCSKHIHRIINSQG